MNPLILLILSLSVIGAPAKSLSVYVATNGNDAWSGTLAVPSASAQDGPFRTVPAALRAPRRLRQTAAPLIDGLSIVFRGSRHELTEPIALLPEDSGRNAEQPFTL